LEPLDHPLSILFGSGLPLPLVEHPASLGLLLVLDRPLLRVASGFAFFVAAVGCANTGTSGASSAIGATAAVSSASSPMETTTGASSAIL
jgi:hypothetical protein